jgi:hypothetical protein
MARCKFCGEKLKKGDYYIEGREYKNFLFDDFLMIHIKCLNNFKGVKPIIKKEVGEEW